ncbi:MAG: SGNH/GDSL hydrolase family protein, partial [Anaerolineae bacterium]|nr:SGNH/GDSL hydrolase family protein [Anaerolineae bacterium]
QSYARLGQLPAQAQVVLEARSPDATWVVGHTPGGTLRGWLAAGYLLVDHAALEALPVSTEPVASLPVGGGEAAAPTTPITTQAIIDVSLSTEALAHARELFAAGQALGNQPDSFIAIGDSAVGGNVDTLPMFHSIVNRTYELGDYAYLQHTIDYFSRTFSFYVERGTARAGNGTINILDPLLADPALCEPGENALACEIRRQHPGVALVYIGFVDLSVSTVEQYAANLDTILQQCMASGVIPVLTTLTASRSTLAGYNNVERFDAMNNAIRGFAAGYALPLIDLQVAAAGLPNQGTRTNDGVHLSYSAAGQVSFAGDQHRYGSDLRELLTLLMLDTLRINVLGG